MLDITDGTVVVSSGKEETTTTTDGAPCKTHTHTLHTWARTHAHDDETRDRPLALVHETQGGVIQVQSEMYTLTTGYTVPGASRASRTQLQAKKLRAATSTPSSPGAERSVNGCSQLRNSRALAVSLVSLANAVME